MCVCVCVCVSVCTCACAVPLIEMMSVLDNVKGIMYAGLAV